MSTAADGGGGRPQEAPLVLSRGRREASATPFQLYLKANAGLQALGQRQRPEGDADGGSGGPGQEGGARQEGRGGDKEVKPRPAGAGGGGRDDLDGRGKKSQSGRGSSPLGNGALFSPAVPATPAPCRAADCVLTSFDYFILLISAFHFGTDRCEKGRKEEGKEAS